MWMTYITCWKGKALIKQNGLVTVMLYQNPYPLKTEPEEPKSLTLPVMYSLQRGHWVCHGSWRLICLALKCPLNIDSVLGMAYFLW